MGQVLAIVKATEVAVKAIIAAVVVVKTLVALFKERNPEPNPIVEQLRVETMNSDPVRERWPYPMTPDVWPTEDEFNRAMSMIREEGGKRQLHFGVSGVVKSGKSSLLNSFRGLGARDPGAARVGSSETTVGVTRYNDPRPDYPFAWYDIAGFGTASVPAQRYFNSHGLFALDCILILIKDSFQESDAALIKQCRNLSIPTYLVRSFSDQRINSILEDGAPSYADARAEYIRDAEENARKGLGDFQLGEQRVYLINARAMLSLVRESSPMPDSIIHEAKLLRDVLQECRQRRFRNI
jgi:hypothetical protein